MATLETQCSAFTYDLFVYFSTFYYPYSNIHIPIFIFLKWQLHPKYIGFLTYINNRGMLQYDAHTGSF